MNLDRLRLDAVLALLERAGQPLPDRASTTEEDFVQILLDGLCELSTTDPMTGLLNRRAFLWVLEQELDRVARGGEHALLLAVDIDHFKCVNDTYGHLVGDQVIRAVAEALKGCVRPMDTVARIGGEEFCIACPSCSPSFAPVVAERVRTAVAARQFAIEAGLELSVTVSCGGAFATPWIRGAVNDWLERADQQLYRAKREGRNCVRLEEMLSTDVSAEEKGLLLGLGQTAPLMIENRKNA
ncbi:GGDEF domain-containing protein [Tepidicella baoligensis]|uniref:GGDEF domain-containing protein n=1 Tax=Tepidicella baoligensis TaxID=2707016 RepID=UPI0015D96E3C|nr:GGDEF domain-containing protein [Tepidicella baoligensis]